MRDALFSMRWLLGGVASFLWCVHFFRGKKTRYQSTFVVLSSGKYNVVHIGYDTKKEEYVVMTTIQNALFQNRNNKRLSVYVEGGRCFRHLTILVL